MTNYFRGHQTENLNGEYVFSDTKESVEKTWQNRACGHCDKYFTKEGHDGCLGELIGLMNACCGHGGKHLGAYVQFWDRTCVRDEDALTIMGILKRWTQESENIDKR